MNSISQPHFSAADLTEFTTLFDDQDDDTCYDSSMASTPIDRSQCSSTISFDRLAMSTPPPRNDTPQSNFSFSSSESRTSSPPAHASKEVLANLKETNKREYRRQVHIRSEHKRRVAIKEAILAYREVVPGLNARGSKLSKNAIATLSSQYLEGLLASVMQLEAQASFLKQQANKN